MYGICEYILPKLTPTTPTDWYSYESPMGRVWVSQRNSSMKVSVHLDLVLDLGQVARRPYDPSEHL